MCECRQATPAARLHATCDTTAAGACPHTPHTLHPTQRHAGYFNTQLKSVLADAVIARLGEFEPSVLADTAWAFGQALYYDYDLMTNLHE